MIRKDLDIDEIYQIRKYLTTRDLGLFDGYFVLGQSKKTLGRPLDRLLKRLDKCVGLIFSENYIDKTIGIMYIQGCDEEEIAEKLDLKPSELDLKFSSK
jgi:hypothetical protein